MSKQTNNNSVHFAQTHHTTPMDNKQPPKRIIRTRLLPSYGFSDYSVFLGSGKGGQGQGQFHNPYGVAFDSKHKSIVVTDHNNHRLQFFSQQDGKFLFAYGSEGTKGVQFNCPKGVCIQPATNNVIVTDSHRLHVFSVSSVSASSLEHLFSVGSAKEGGSGPSQFNNPTGICCTARGDIIVADSNNNRMQIFDCKGRHIRAFGSLGDGNNQFQYPFDVCVQEDANRMIITDCYNNRLSVWSVDGCEPILTVPAQGSPTGICNYPHTHRIVVNCAGYGSNDIKVIDTKTKNEWNVIQRFGSEGERPGQFKWPSGVCVDDRGVLFVADFGNNRVQAYGCTERSYASL